MIRQHDDAADLDSNCYCAPLGTEGPTDATCKTDATTWVYLPSGIRRYICADHADQVDRFGDTDDAHPRVRECKRCHKPTPLGHLDHEGICEGCQV